MKKEVESSSACTIKPIWISAFSFKMRGLLLFSLVAMATGFLLPPSNKSESSPVKPPTEDPPSGDFGRFSRHPRRSSPAPKETSDASNLHHRSTPEAFAFHHRTTGSPVRVKRSLGFEQAAAELMPDASTIDPPREKRSVEDEAKKDKPVNWWVPYTLPILPTWSLFNNEEGKTPMPVTRLPSPTDGLGRHTTPRKDIRLPTGSPATDDALFYDGKGSTAILSEQKHETDSLGHRTTPGEEDGHTAVVNKNHRTTTRNSRFRKPPPRTTEAPKSDIAYSPEPSEGRQNRTSSERTTPDGSKLIVKNPSTPESAARENRRSTPGKDAAPTLPSRNDSNLILKHRSTPAPPKIVQRTETASLSRRTTPGEDELEGSGHTEQEFHRSTPDSSKIRPPATARTAGEAEAETAAPTGSNDIKYSDATKEQNRRRRNNTTPKGSSHTSSDAPEEAQSRETDSLERRTTPGDDSQASAERFHLPTLPPWLKKFTLPHGWTFPHRRTRATEVPPTMVSPAV
ncbi:unnamed protein product [Caenorhabditis auriculariae]|uniref:Uncharacterized protein n=1 Tax=Caenorhabditis auriculariae TaxID=2777116 RepID=A0A8S1HHD2_9PELO|nr:unnamed protein product [Caenorhabditis auriculariae]